MNTGSGNPSELINSIAPPIQEVTSGPASAPKKISVNLHRVEVIQESKVRVWLPPLDRRKRFAPLIGTSSMGMSKL